MAANRARYHSLRGSFGTFDICCPYDVEELLEERGLAADHTTVWRWVQRYAPERQQRLRRHPN
jgi:hypothetical protein